MRSSFNLFRGSARPGWPDKGCDPCSCADRCLSATSDSFGGAVRTDIRSNTCTTVGQASNKRKNICSNDPVGRTSRSSREARRSGGDGSGRGSAHSPTKGSLMSVITAPPPARTRLPHHVVARWAGGLALAHVVRHARRLRPRGHRLARARHPRRQGAAHPGQPGPDQDPPQRVRRVARVLRARAGDRARRAHVLAAYRRSDVSPPRPSSCSAPPSSPARSRSASRPEQRPSTPPTTGSAPARSRPSMTCATTASCSRSPSRSGWSWPSASRPLPSSTTPAGSGGAASRSVWSASSLTPFVDNTVSSLWLIWWVGMGVVLLREKSSQE